MKKRLIIPIALLTVGIGSVLHPLLTMADNSLTAMLVVSGLALLIAGLNLLNGALERNRQEQAELDKLRETEEQDRARTGKAFAEDVLRRIGKEGGL